MDKMLTIQRKLLLVDLIRRRHVIYLKKALYKLMGNNHSAMTRIVSISRVTFLAVSSVLLAISVVNGSIAQESTVDFNRDIRPVLSDKCYFCHGPDEESRGADLRFDVEEEARDSIESGEFVDRILSDDPDYIMPKPESHLSLTDKEKKLLQQWVEEGAHYDQHWAFVPLPDSVASPAVSDAAWSQQTLDRFVLARLDQESMTPTTEASPLRWLRRVSFDLTGLPPAESAIEEFKKQIATTTTDAQRAAVYSSQVDRLLASNSWGEHMAVSWLDAARYADSYGYQSDKLNTQWPYRDWVVKAFNDNLPYDTFLTWQLAGDMLEKPTTEQKLATAFNRIHRLNNEGGAIFEEWRLENVADRVHTYGSAVLGLTFECCRCHDHKYDPISMRDYYSLSAFFNSIDENGLYDRTDKVPSPTLLLPTEEQTAAIEKAKSDIAAAEVKLRSAVERVEQKFSAGDFADAIQEAREKKTLSEQLLMLDFDKPFDKKNKEIYHPSASDRNWTKELPLVDAASNPYPRPEPFEGARKAMALDGEAGITIEKIKPFDRWIPFSVVFNFREKKRIPDRSVIAHHTRGTDAGYNGWDLTIVDGHLESRMYRIWPGNAMGVRTVEPIPENQWHLLVATWDGMSKATGLKLFLNGKELATSVLRDNKLKSANVKVDHGGEFVVGQRFRDRGLAGGQIADVRIFSRAITNAEIQFLTSGKPIEADAQYIAAVVDEDAGEAMKELLAAQEAFVAAEESMDEVPVMEETETARPAHLLARGAYDAKTSDETLVSRVTPSHIGPSMALQDGRQADRVSLAQWTVDRKNPLTGRVIVNRLWANFFGAGLVRTPENFGLQGELPTHPELLDYLAVDFVDNGWDIKRFCKKVVLSATYRQDSVASKEALNKDPENRLLGRGPAYRLGAEQIRDLMLTASGLINPQIGGPPVSPYQPGGDLWKESNTMSPAYQQSVGKSLYRRSLYSVWKRTAPLPNMMAFDTSSREVCTIARSRTNTPLQALVLLNDVQYVEAARHLAQQVLLIDNQDDQQKIQTAFVRLTSRQADQLETSTLLELLDEERVYYADHPDEAAALIKLGDSAVDEGIETAQLAAMTTTIQAIMNLDATFTKR